MATISETTGEDRIAELKRKMQESAKRTKAEHEAQQAEEASETSAVATAEAEPVSAEQEAQPVAVATEESAVAEPAAPPVESNGAVAAAPAALPADAGATVTAPASTAAVESFEEDPEAQARAEMTRREFITYAWGAALGLLAVETGLMSYFFMYPRFRAGEFGGQFFLTQADVPSLEAAPVPETAGKFWLVNTDEGPRALYMVCTHLGCLYKWEASNNRFECPCHGSKFSKDGFYIEGPAPRSLDQFEITGENAEVIVDTGKKIVGSPATESPARAVQA
ncbi:MAG: Rieske 2Fe-2S domain-containing protein [Caldilineaceae bacterium]|nr:Rieske 2Fe-2S domain-containing protein [Caldilineaceae bacterium]